MVDLNGTRCICIKSLLLDAQKLAEVENTTFRNLVEEGLRLVIAARQKKNKFSIKAEDIPVCGGGFTDEFKHQGWDRIREEIYRGRGE